jgi:hypothetical protein
MMQVVTLNTTVLEGHRFCVTPIKKDEYLTSWSLPFAIALCDIAPGECVHHRPRVHRVY